ncbi:MULTISPECIES: hypothetical protein [Bacillus]|uniref:hypothetical protein n=1 Tax=Bacillus TaxID=1386 RepID=UPI000BB8995D|nr:MULTISPECIES: hypothetical protein [Bacillus]
MLEKFKITLYGILIGFVVSLLYSVYVYFSDPNWGDLTSIASFIVLFPTTVLIALVVQVGYFIYKKRNK